MEVIDQWQCAPVSHQLEPAEVLLEQIDSFQESAPTGPSLPSHLRTLPWDFSQIDPCHRPIDRPHPVKKMSPVLVLGGVQPLELVVPVLGAITISRAVRLHSCYGHEPAFVSLCSKWPRAPPAHLSPEYMAARARVLHRFEKSLNYRGRHTLVVCLLNLLLSR